MKYVYKIKGLGFILWQARHEFYHLLIGLVWAWFLREWWGEFRLRWVWFAIIGSLLPDLDHFIYFFTYGKHDWYTKQVKSFFRNREWRNLSSYVASGHKLNTELSYHNLYFVTLLFGMTLLSTFFDWQAGVILFGAMILHYIFDIFDDLIILGSLNPNWKRWGRNRQHKSSE